MKRIIFVTGAIFLLVAVSLFTFNFTDKEAVEAAQQEQKEMMAPMHEGLDKVRAELKAIKEDLTEEGHYSCCIAPSCDFCALSMNGCPCGMNLMQEEPVCGECKGGWDSGFGALPDVQARNVKVAPPDMVKMMYESRAMKYGVKK
jgi:hypothetical protein